LPGEGVDDRVEAVLWPRTAGGRALRPGVSYKRPEGGRGWADAKPSQAEWADLWDAVPPGERRAALLRSAAWVSSLNVDWILGEPADADDPGDPGARDRAYDRYIAVRTGAHESWLVTLPGGLQPYPVRLRTDARRCASLLDAMRISAIESSALAESENEQPPEQRQAEATPESEHLGNRLRRRIRDLEKRRAALRRQLEGESAEDLRDLGNLLLARKGEVPKGAERATLTGFDGREVEVSLDPRLDAIRNAERLYDRARRRERAARSIPDRVQRTEDRIAQLESGLETVNATGATAELWDLVGGRPEGTDSSRRDERSAREAPLPYRRYRSSGGLEIRVGRSSRTNDALTFRHSAPDDIWLHARQAAGAHVILRWGSRDQNPPSADLEEAARIAAVHSEARHSGLVAVDWTRRKHVRKPRKAAPGAVVPERVKTLFVEPDAAAIEKLAVDE
jgi:predicted ribosome quality control (RQC) complex YloA/Tae2 family protein